jgi:hypothetical protein
MQACARIYFAGRACDMLAGKRGRRAWHGEPVCVPLIEGRRALADNWTLGRAPFFAAPRICAPMNKPALAACLKNGPLWLRSR